MRLHLCCAATDDVDVSPRPMGVHDRMNIQHRIASVYLNGLRREEGQTMTEYGVLLALIAVVVIVALLVLGPKIATLFNKVANQL